MFANKTGNRWKRLLAALLTVCLCLAAASFSAFAVPNEEEPEGGSQGEGSEGGQGEGGAPPATQGESVPNPDIPVNPNLPTNPNMEE